MRPVTQCERCDMRSYQKVENDCAEAYRAIFLLRDALQMMVDWCEVPYCETYQPVIKARGALKEVAKLTATAHKPTDN